MLRIEIDSEKKVIELEVRLEGQAETLQVRAADYRLVGEPGARRLVCSQLESRSGWLNVILKTLRLGDKGVPLPPEYEDLIVLAL